MTLQRLIDKEKELQGLMDEFEIDPDDYSDEFDDSLDEHKIVIMGITYSGSQIVKNCSMIDYNTHLSYFVDGKDKTDDPRYIELADELRDISASIEELENDVKEEE